MSEASRASRMTTPARTATLEERERRFRLFRAIAWISFAAFSVFLLGYIAGWFLIPDFPVLLIWADVVAVLLTVAVGLMLRRGMSETALRLYVGGVTLVLFVAIYFVNGVTGPIVLALPLIALIAGELGGRQMAYVTAGVHIGLYLLLALLEFLGIIAPFQMPGIVSRIVWVGIFITGTAVTVAVNQQFVAFMQAALASSERREHELTAANRRAQEAVEAERELQEQAVAATQRLQETVRVYSDFLERVNQGDYESVLDMDILMQEREISPELVDLGQYLKTTVRTLVAALAEAQVAQQRYLQQSWDAVAKSSVIPAGYRFENTGVEAEAGAQVEIAEDAWLAPMTEAVIAKSPAVGEGELAVPIMSGAGAQLIGAMGMRRKDVGAWSEDDLAIITAVTDQLAQTIENLRLIDETTRRATREQAAGEITGRIREAVEIEAVLERALTELGQAFAAERGTAYLTMDAQQEDGV